MKNLTQGVPLQTPEFQVRLFTDASTKGWGAHLEGQTAQGSWSEQEQDLHINILEMRAIKLALLAFNIPQKHNILVATDNTTVVSYVNKQGGTRSLSLWRETQDLIDLVIRNMWILKARHIPGKLNVIADQLSREGQTLPTEWSLHPDIVKWIFQEMGTPLVDLFATKYNHKLPLYVSPVPDEKAIDTDALSISWEQMDIYAFPPHQILPKVLEKLWKTEKCRMILVAPKWKNQLWFPDLIKMANPNPLPLPHWPTLLKQPQSSIFHSQPGLLNLHAWMLRKGL